MGTQFFFGRVEILGAVQGGQEREKKDKKKEKSGKGVEFQDEISHRSVPRDREKKRGTVLEYFPQGGDKDKTRQQRPGGSQPTQ